MGTLHFAKLRPGVESALSPTGLRSVTATHLIRKMRGGSQAHLVMADDEQAYVVKFSNNPQHPRTLVNELVVSAVLLHLRISAPETGIIRITKGFLKKNPGVYLTVGSKRCPVMPGRHFRSSYPGDPTRTSVYDFLPDPMLARVVNLTHFLGAFVVDKWTANSDTRQSIFVRASPEEIRSPGSGFVVQMIDHGGAFDGAHWQFRDSPLRGLYFRPSVYDQVNTIDSLQPWIDEVRRFPEHVLKHAREQVPEEWLQGDDHSRLEGMMESLLRRCSSVADLIGASLDQRNALPNRNERGELAKCSGADVGCESGQLTEGKETK
jgi:hypothetical protein